MYNTSASDLERVVSDLGQIVRTYTNAAQELDQQVITLEGAVSYVLSDGVMQWKGLSSEAFASAWLERRTRLQQASMLMSESAGHMTTLAQAIESNLPIIRAEQSIQLQPIFATMASNEQQAVLDEVSQAQNAIFTALAVLNSQLEALAEEVSDCPQVDREASSPGLYDNISRSDAGGGSAAQTPEQRIENEVGDPVLAELLIEQANQNGANLEDVATLLEKGIEPGTIAQLVNNGADLGDITVNAQTLLDGGVKVELVNGWLSNGTHLNDAIAVMNQGVDLNLVGTSSQIGNFTGLEGTSVNEIVSRIPADAKIVPWTPEPGRIEKGMKFEWQDAAGKSWTLRIHEPDPLAPAGSNAAKDWVFRVKIGNKYIDATGKLYTPNALSNPASSNYDPQGANKTHMPIQRP